MALYHHLFYPLWRRQLSDIHSSHRMCRPLLLKKARRSNRPCCDWWVNRRYVRPLSLLAPYIINRTYKPQADHFPGIIFPLMLQRLFPLVGFKWAVRILAFIFLLLLTFANLLIRSNPLILPPTKAGVKTEDILPDYRIFKNKIFALTTAGVFFIEWALFIPISYISSYAIANGVNETFSYQVLSILNAGSFFGRWLPGYMADKCGRFNAMIVTCALCLISVFCLWLTCSPASGPGGIAQLCIFAVLFGMASGSNISLTPVCVGQLCETEVFGRWYASLYTIVSFGCLTGIPIAGQILKVNGGSYEGLILFTGGCYALGVGFFVWARVSSVGWGLGKVY